MGFTDWINKVFGGKTKKDGQQNWLQSPMIITSSEYRTDEEGWTYPVNTLGSSDAINNAVDRIASEVSKYQIKSVVMKPEKVQAQNDDITRLFRFGPNPIQTSADFLSALVWMRAKYANVFVYPQYTWVEDYAGQKHKKFSAFWILKPSDFEIGTDEAGNVFEIKFNFVDGGQYILPYEDVIHLKWRRGTNLYKGGGDDSGNADYQDVEKSVKALESTIEGLPKAISSSLQVKGVYNAKSLMDADRMAKQQKEFEKHIVDSRMGMVVTDLAGEFTPVNMTQPVIGEGLVKFMRTGIIQRFGVSDAVLNGDFSSDQYDAFVQTVVESFLIDLEQEFSRKCFTQREQDVGHRIRAYVNKLQYMSVNQKQEMAKIAFNTGTLSVNQVLDMFGLDPIEGGERRLQSLNYVNSNVVDAYQQAQAGMNGEEPSDSTAMSTGNEGGADNAEN